MSIERIMKAPAKIALGLAAISAFPLTALFFGSFIFLIQRYPNDFANVLMDHPAFVALFNLFFTVLLAAPEVIYIVHAARNPNINAMRVTWILSIFFFGPLATPFYWYHHIWRESREKPRSGPLGLNSFEASD